MSWGLLDDALGAFNLIDLVSGFLAGVSYGDVGGHRIAVSTTADSSHSLNEVRAILSKAGVATYRRGFDSEEIWVHVKNRQARWAEYALRRAGVSVNMATVDSRNVGWASQAKHEGEARAVVDAAGKRTQGGKAGREAHRSGNRYFQLSRTAQRQISKAPVSDGRGFLRIAISLKIGPENT
jgi:hypothetical protein